MSEMDFCEQGCASTSDKLALKSHLAESLIDLFLFTSIVIDLCSVATSPSLVTLLFFSLDLCMLAVPEGPLFEALPAYWDPLSSGSLLSSHLILGIQASSN